MNKAGENTPEAEDRDGAPGCEVAITGHYITILNQRGLHARAAAKFVKLVGRFNADVTVSRGGQTVSGLSIMGLMMLAAGLGSEIELGATGPEAPEVIDAICAMVDNKFDED